MIGCRCYAVGNGSSPRVRGKQLARFSPTFSAGLIPACAGKTNSAHQWTPHIQAHPRVCGENKVRAVVVVGLFGSSPRVRGKLTVARPGLRILRLIPACAGKTLHATRGKARVRAHPRVCGENGGGLCVVA